MVIDACSSRTLVAIAGETALGIVKHHCTATIGSHRAVSQIAVACPYDDYLFAACLPSRPSLSTNEYCYCCTLTVIVIETTTSSSWSMHAARPLLKSNAGKRGSFEVPFFLRFIISYFTTCHVLVSLSSSRSHKMLPQIQKTDIHSQPICLNFQRSIHIQNSTIQDF